MAIIGLRVDGTVLRFYSFFQQLSNFSWMEIISRRAISPVDRNHLLDFRIVHVFEALEVARYVGTPVVQRQEIRIFARQDGISSVNGYAIYIHTPTPCHGQLAPPKRRRKNSKQVSITKSNFRVE